MNINFNRNRTQIAIEKILSIDVFNPDKAIQKANQSILENHYLNHQEVQTIGPQIMEDASDYFFNGCISIIEGIEAVFSRRYSWATVKLYYSVFYFLRASLACNKYAIIMVNKLFFRLFIAAGEKVHKIDKKNTHNSVIYCYKSIYDKSDKLLTNNIDLNGTDKNAYDWLEEIRNITNYKQTAFNEPFFSEVWEQYENAEDKVALLKDIVNDALLYCFQGDLSVLAIPIQRLVETKKDFENNHIIPFKDKRKEDYLKGIISANMILCDCFENLLW